MRITLRRSSIRFLAVVFEGGLFLVFVLWASKTFLAYRVAQSPTVGNLLRAVKLDPANADYHLRLGR